MLASPEVVATATVLVPHASASVGATRERVASELLAQGLPPRLVEDSVLVLSEILSNALKHARPLADGKVRVTWALRESRLEVQVTDGGASTRPRVLPLRASATGGRGLGIVRNLSDDWGVSEDGAETTVWARLDLDADARTLRLREYSPLRDR
ncbi:ATP-binding protein [Motilibacter deserti]|uniref:ATP-binding protein n=1 Tax=Motilibacter deserti TaxID=2714956 RepID=A0ABX0GZD7_9ACTN|nr:ATP-binding protein [Motilibacter deserti]